MLLRVVTVDIGEKPFKDCYARLFLRAQNGAGWCLDLHGFRPHMHVDMPSGDIETFTDWITEQTKVDDIETSVVERQSLYGYQGTNTKTLLRMSFRNEIERKRIKKLWFPYTESKKERTPEVTYRDAQLRCYESKVPAVIQFLHVADLNPSGIVRVDKARLSRRVDGFDQMRANHYRAHWRAVTKASDVEACSIPLQVDSEDIEASSSHGDFPMPIKDYSMTAREILQLSKICKRGEWDIEGWLKAALGVGEPMLGISQLELKGELDLGRVVAALQQVLKAPCPDLPRSRDLAEYYNHADDHYEGHGHDVDSNGGECCDDDTESMSSAATRSTTTSTGSKRGRSKRYVTAGITGPTGILMAQFAVHSERQLAMSTLLTNYLPPQEGDTVTYIGIVAGTTDPTMPRRELCFCVPTVSPKNANCELIQCKDERELLLAYAKWRRTRQADLVIGYNIFGFDDRFMNDRASELGIQEDFLSMSLNPSVVCADKVRDGSGWRIHETTITLASGQHSLKQIRVPGTVKIDLYNQFRKELKLESYALNSVAASLLGGKVQAVKPDDSESHVVVLEDTQGVVEGGMIALMVAKDDPDRRVVLGIDGANVTVTGSSRDWTSWGFAKDNVTPQDIFRMSTSGDPEEATLVANYCKQDCALVYGLFDKVDTYTAMTEMSNISCVPLEFLVLRGQGIKLTSLLVKACNQRGRVVEDISKDHPDEPYEGAAVLDPHPGIYRDPVTCLDYSSLYPSADISDNVSHETIKWSIQYDMDGNEVSRKGDFDSPLVEGHHIITRTIPTYKRVHVPKKTGGFKKVKKRSGTRKIAIVQYALGEHALMPTVLMSLLKQRKVTRKRGKHKRAGNEAGECFEGAVVEDDKGNLVANANGELELTMDDGTIACIPMSDIVKVEWRFNDFIRNVFDKRQLTYKVLANSLYGGTGAATSMFYEINVAALITAIGRAMLRFAQAMMEKIYNSRFVHVDGEPYIVTAHCIYGDTDSVFVHWRVWVAVGHSTLQEGEELHGQDSLPIVIAVSQQAEQLASSCLRKPHTLEYEKTFLPWLLLTRKRYAGDKVEKITDKPKLKAMGLMIRRRDNARVARNNFTAVLDDLLHKDTKTAFNNCLKGFKRVQKGDVPREDLIVSKSLRGHYADPERIAHKVLADRVAERDPGNAPRPGDRIPYVYIKVADQKLKQKDRIELPEVAGDNIDYRYYIEHQMLKPVAQLFALDLEHIPDARRRCPASAFREGAPLATRTKAAQKMLSGALAPVGQKSVKDFFG
jgi:DNA polymerase elongation subunit (family B)